VDARRGKFVALGVGVAATMAFLVGVAVSRSGSGGLVYYVTVPEFLARGGSTASNVRVNGKVVSGSIERLPTGQDVTFTMAGGGAEIRVAYHGIIPDTFVDGADVVVEGGLRADGVFEASTLLAKCPSKYEAAEGAEEASR
jgi:cytochrome c-type biogenesis protein CcmE